MSGRDQPSDGYQVAITARWQGCCVSDASRCVHCRHRASQLQPPSPCLVPAQPLEVAVALQASRQGLIPCPALASGLQSHRACSCSTVLSLVVLLLVFQAGITLCATLGHQSDRQRTCCLKAFPASGHSSSGPCRGSSVRKRDRSSSLIQP